MKFVARALVVLLAIIIAAGTFTTALSSNAAVSAANERQIVSFGGSNTSDDGSITVSKRILGTDVENVFNIILTARCKQVVADFDPKPDMAVVIVLDCSNSMNSAFGTTNRYIAAIEAAQDFVDEFQNATSSSSKLGLVTFNTNSYESITLSACNTNTDAANIKDEIDSTVRSITEAVGYADSNDRFTNIEAGIERATEILASATNENKFIIFLSDGFPTTYSSTGYTGYAPISTEGEPNTEGVFYDNVEHKYCIYGTSYSDEAAIRGRVAATAAKTAGISIFTIGIAIGDQTIDQYVLEHGDTYSIVQRTDHMNYEIGIHNDVSAYKNWLKTGIGSNYYYDSTSPAELKDAYDKIFDEIIKEASASLASLWVTTDPIPQSNNIEFIAFYANDGALKTALTGTAAENGENTAKYNTDTNTIKWDLRKSGYSKITGSITEYVYSLKYKIRLANEKLDFTEGSEYETNGETSLTFQYFENQGGVPVMKSSTVEFDKIPVVKGYLVDLDFIKLGKVLGDDDDEATPLAGAEFTLRHDEDGCPACTDDTNHASEIENFVAVSDADGNVSFENVPSGHTYILEETDYPDDYYGNGDTYYVSVDYDKITLTVTHEDQTTTVWTGEGDSIINLINPPKETSDKNVFEIAAIVIMGAVVCLTMVYKRKGTNC